MDQTNCRASDDAATGHGQFTATINKHTAAITVSRMGAMPSLPTVEEVQQLLVERDYQGFDPAELDALKQ